MIIWLASYPKSGNTWLRSLLAAYFFSKNGKFNFELLKNIGQFPSPDHFRNYSESFLDPTDTAKYWIKEQEKINSDNKVRFIKTHNALCNINGNSFTNNKNTLGVIYIIRDPRNVITSLRNHYEISLEAAFEFMTEKKKAIYEKEGQNYLGFNPLFSWKLHLKSWADNILYPTLIIRYEDLEMATFNTFKKVIKFISTISKSKEKFISEKALSSIRSCEFDKLKKLESEEGFREAMISKTDNKKINFFHLGKKNNYKNLLDADFINKLNLEFQNEINKYGY